MSDERKKPRRWCRTAAVLLGLPVLYLASFGPALWLFDHGLLAPETVVTVWKPLYLCERSDTLREWFHWYCFLWIRGRWMP